jgi:hypothetical protein
MALNKALFNKWKQTPATRLELAVLLGEGHWYTQVVVVGGGDGGPHHDLLLP